MHDVLDSSRQVQSGMDQGDEVRLRQLGGDRTHSMLPSPLASAPGSPAVRHSGETGDTWLDTHQKYLHSAVVSTDHMAQSGQKLRQLIERSKIKYDK